MNDHTAHDCKCTDGTETVTIREDALSTYRGLCMHSWRQPESQSYRDKLEPLQGKVVTVDHVFRGVTGLSYAYSAAGLHLPALLAVEQL